jgi:tetratricopeptide (TPR) repeat protein
VPHAALDAPEPDPTPTPASDLSSLRSSLSAADALRASGHPSDAADLLDRALSRFPDDPAAGLAAFTLGRLALDVLGDPSRASAAFARVIALGSPSSLLEDAHARRADALLRAGRLDDAEDAILSYEHAYPKGRRAAALRARLDAAR